MEKVLEVGDVMHNFWGCSILPQLLVILHLRCMWWGGMADGKWCHGLLDVDHYSSAHIMTPYHPTSCPAYSAIYVIHIITTACVSNLKIPLGRTQNAFKSWYFVQLGGALFSYFLFFALFPFSKWQRHIGWDLFSNGQQIKWAFTTPISPSEEDVTIHDLSLRSFALLLSAGDKRSKNDLFR